MGGKPSKGTSKDKRLHENKPRPTSGKRTYKPDPKPSQRGKKK